MKLWVDDVRPAPEGYVWAKSVNEAKNIICETLSADGVSGMFGSCHGVCPEGI